MNDTATQPPSINPYADAAASFTAMMTVGNSLRQHNVVNADSGDGNPLREITRDIWFDAAGNLLKSGVLTKQQKAKLKAKRDELRRTKVKS